MTTEFIIENETHTLGNLIRTELLKNENVLFAAYKIAHPLEKKLSVSVLTDETITPQDAVYVAITDLQETVSVLKEKWNELDK